MKIGDTLLQPVQQALVSQTHTTASDVVVGSSWLLFHFQIDDPDMLRRFAVATFIDANGKRNSHKITLPESSIRRAKKGITGT